MASKQSKEIEIKEENFLMDLYYHTLSNSHVFNNTEKKSEFKKNNNLLMKNIPGKPP